MNGHRKKESIDDINEEELGIVKELFLFLRENKKYWLAPIIIVLLLLGVLIAMNSSSAAPFIYTLF